MIEYLTNLWEVGQPTCQLIALPLSGLGTIILKWLDLTFRKIMKYAKSVLQNQRILLCSRYMISF